jgi:hypothetical protein
VSRDVYEGIRQAQPSDVRTVEEIIRPLEDQVREFCVFLFICCICDVLDVV